jgi:glutathione S-transferase
MLRLFVYDYNYSSWSMRAGLVLRKAGLAFHEVNAHETDEPWEVAKQRSPTGRFPLLEDHGLVVWDSLAIAEHIAERCPAAQLWPAEPFARAQARAITAEMHSGFTSLRQELPMNIRARHLRYPKSARARRDIDRVLAIWQEARARNGALGPWLFGHFTIADAFFVPVALRFRTYDVITDPLSRTYLETVFGDPAVQDWIERAHQQKWVNPEYELVAG